MQNAPESPADGIVVGCETKTCTKCKEAKPTVEFSVRSKEQDGRHYACRPCVSLEAKNRYAANPEKYGAMAKAYSAKNPEIARARAKAWYEANKERALAAQKEKRAIASAARPPSVKVELSPEQVEIKRLHKKEVKARWAASDYLANRERVIAASRARELANPEGVKAYRAVWRAKNGQEIRTKHKAYREKNSERHLAMQRRWSDRNKDKVRASRKAWSGANREKINEKNKAWGRSNPGRKAEHCANRRRRLRKVPWTSRIEILQMYREAAHLTKSTGVPHEVDHVYAIDGISVSGLHVQGNLRVVPRSVNRVKSTKLPGHLAHELWDPAGPAVFHG